MSFIDKLLHTPTHEDILWKLKEKGIKTEDIANSPSAEFDFNIRDLELSPEERRALEDENFRRTNPKE
jgi:hypothetical protein